MSTVPATGLTTLVRRSWSRICAVRASLADVARGRLSLSACGFYLRDERPIVALCLIQLLRRRRFLIVQPLDPFVGAECDGSLRLEHAGLSRDFLDVRG